MAKVEFTGNIGRDAELGFSQSGTPNLKFNVADTKGKKDAQGNWDKTQEKTNGSAAHSGAPTPNTMPNA